MTRNGLTPSSSPPLDRFFWLAIFLAAVVVIPRSILITRAHSPCEDAQFHLRRGLYFLTGEPKGLVLFMEDGLLGQALNALPMLVSGSTMEEPIHAENMPNYWQHSNPPLQNAAQKFAEVGRQNVLFGHALSPDALLLRIAIWQAILFIPFAALVFHWSRWLYGLHAGFVGLALLLVDPNFAAHIPMATIDVLSAETIVLACFAMWLWVRDPNMPRMMFAAFAGAFALLTKQIAVVVPVAAVGYAAIWWLHPRSKHAFSSKNYRLPFHRLANFSLLFFLFIWALTKFDFSAPSESINAIRRPAGGGFSLAADIFYPALQQRWPAGQYIAAFINSVWMDMAGRWSFLFGHARVGGWWYYYPALLGLKAPLGFFVVFLLALYSLRRRKPFFEEWSLMLPAILWGGLMFTSRVNIGIRHFLPEYAILLMLASRSAVDGAKAVGMWLNRWLIWSALGISALSVAAFHPDYLSYINWPYRDPWLLMSDSNIDWGQGLKETRQWLDMHPAGTRPVYIRYDWEPVWVDYYLQGRAKRITQFQTPPSHGLLIICPVWVAGYWDPVDTYAYLRACDPGAVIGHSMLVYDLDHLRKAPRMHP